MSRTPEAAPVSAAAADPNAPFLIGIKHTNRMVSEGFSFSGDERNCFFLNTAGPRFATASAVTGFDLADDGRSLGRVDWDLDGDLDLWITNRTAPRVRYLRNDNPPVNHFVTVRLTGRTCNRDAIGARVEVTPGGETNEQLVATVRAGEGFLGQSSKRLHFGLGQESGIKRITVRWPDGPVDEFTNVSADRHYVITQKEAAIEEFSPLVIAEELQPTTFQKPPETSKLRLLLTAKAPLPRLVYRRLDGQHRSLDEHRDRPLVVNLWASWCAPCLAELGDFASRHDKLQAAGLDVLAISVDGVGEGSAGSEQDAARIATRMQWPFLVGIADVALVEKLQIVHNQLVGRHRPLPVPTSLLIDGDGRLAALYKGPVSVEQLLADLQAMQLEGDALRNASLPFAGMLLSEPGEFRAAALANALIEAGYVEDAIDYVNAKRRQLLGQAESSGLDDSDVTELFVSLGNEYAKQERFAEAEEQYRAALANNPEYAGALFNLGLMLEHQGRLDDAVGQYREVIRLEPYRAVARLNLGAILLRRERTVEALAQLKEAAQLAPELAPARLHLGAALEKSGHIQEALVHYRAALALSEDDPTTIYQLAQCLERLNENTEAESHFRRVVELLPDYAAARMHLAVLLERTERSPEALAHYRRVIDLEPDHAPALNNLAWLLATHQDARLRDGTEAVRLAQRALDAAGSEQPALLDTLAAAYAASGELALAIQTAERALELLTTTRDGEALAREIRGRLKLYQDGKPYRAP